METCRLGGRGDRIVSHCVEIFGVDLCSSIGDGPGVRPLETWNLDSQGHWECLLLWNSLGGPWYIQLVSVYDLVVLASDVGVNLAHGW